MDKIKRHIAVDICTKGRYFTTLPLTLMSIVNQTISPDIVYIYDDNEKPVDIRTIPSYLYILKLLDYKDIKWEVIHGLKKGQHFGHQMIQDIAKDLVWRIDDDEIAEPNCLETLLNKMSDDIGAVGCLVLDPSNISNDLVIPTGLISNINSEPNTQWIARLREDKIVEHLYSSFLYRKGVAKYELSLSPVAHREETLFTHSIFRKGYKLLVTSDCKIWHFRSPEGGIRNGDKGSWNNDEITFKQIMGEWNGKLICIVKEGKGDAVCFRSILPKLKEKYKVVLVATMFPELFEGEKLIPLEQAYTVTNPERSKVYKWCIENNWKGKLKDAYYEMYTNL